MLEQNLKPLIEIETLKHLKAEDIKIEVIGFWIWISGNTFPIKDRLKEIGFLYSGNKKAWFFNGSAKKHKRSFCSSLDEIKQRYLSQEVI